MTTRVWSSVVDDEGEKGVRNDEVEDVAGAEGQTEAKGEGGEGKDEEEPGMDVEMEQAAGDERKWDRNVEEDVDEKGLPDAPTLAEPPMDVGGQFNPDLEFPGLPEEEEEEEGGVISGEQSVGGRS